MSKSLFSNLPLLQSKRCEHVYAFSISTRMAQHVFKEHPETREQIETGICMKCRTRQVDTLENWSEYFKRLLLEARRAAVADRQPAAIEKLANHFNENRPRAL